MHPMTKAQAEATDHVLGTVAGSVFRSDTQSDVIIMLHDDNYAIAVDADGHMASAYLVTVEPGAIAGAMDADRDEISGWYTGTDI